VRKQAFEKVEQVLKKAIKKEPSNHAAFGAQAEFWEGQGQIFHAFESVKTAKERSPKGSAERVAYERELVRLGALIESGAAAKIMQAAGHEVPTTTEAKPTSAGPRRDAGSTTIRRKKNKDSGELASEAAEAAPTEKPEEAVEAAAEEAVEAAAEETPEPVAEEAAVEAAAEEAVEAAAEETSEPVAEEAAASDQEVNANDLKPDGNTNEGPNA
jgi:hypothetical protein